MPRLRDNLSPKPDCPEIPASADEQRKMRATQIYHPDFQMLSDAAEPLEKRLQWAAINVWEFFHSSGYKILRSDWDNKSVHKALLRYRGWVYAFYGVEDYPIYVGETGRTLTHRFREHEKKCERKEQEAQKRLEEQEQFEGQEEHDESPAPWWPEWSAVKVLPCPEQSVRKVFESLIGLAGGYNANRAQPPGLDNIFDEVLLSLLLLGNNNGRLSIFPTVPNEND